MRTALFLLAGISLLVTFFVLARLFSTQYSDAPAVAFVAYVVLWFAVAAFNMWVGVAKAGYSFTEELPIFLLIFGVPAIVAGIVRWKLL
jgi:hypothetical protein